MRSRDALRRSLPDGDPLERAEQTLATLLAALERVDHHEAVDPTRSPSYLVGYAQAGVANALADLRAALRRPKR